MGWTRRPWATLFLALALLFVGAPCGGATVLTGPIVDLPESGGPFTCGDGVHDLFQDWSVYNPQSSGWFYGSTYPWSNADVYVYRGLADPTQVTNADTFSYTSGVDWASEGDCVFYRGTNGYYGAWRIDAITPLSGGPPYAELDGQWYFQDDGSGDFSGGGTAALPTTWGAVKSLFR